MAACLLSLMSFSCGGGGGGSGGGEDAAVTTLSNMKMAGSKADISCNAAAKDFMFYVSSESTFYLCDGVGLSVIDVKGKDGAAGVAGSAGTAGLTISSMYNLSSTVSDYCTRYTNITCSFRGGRLVKYSNGLVYFSGGLVNQENYILANNVDYDTNAYVIDNDGYVSSGLSYSSLLKIARTGSDTLRQLWITYDISTDVAQIRYDTNNNGILDASDDLVDTLTKSPIIP
ncbi:MAG: hypothetical protein EOP48_22055 [Sphingobacteriales bacterium]|nr:MAG: hypothetical protein EOP48_22055 [Sphingobacteriales bacterium]